MSVRSKPVPDHWSGLRQVFLCCCFCFLVVYALADHGSLAGLTQIHWQPVEMEDSLNHIHAHDHEVGLIAPTPNRNNALGVLLLELPATLFEGSSHPFPPVFPPPKKF